MKREETENILSIFCEKYDEYFDIPSSLDWESLSGYFNTDFDSDFVTFINLMSEWAFPGEIYNVTENNNNGNDTIKTVYDFEMNCGEWNKNMIPFCAIASGDYFCIDSNNKSVMYFYHDKQEFEFYCNDFEEWIKGLPEFIKGSID